MGTEPAKLDYSLFDIFKGKDSPQYVFPAELRLDVKDMIEDTLHPDLIELDRT